MYVPLTPYSSSSSSSSVFSLPFILYMIADSGYEAKKLYGYSKKVLGIDLVCPLLKDTKYSKERLEIVCFYHSILGQATIYNRRRISIEPLIEHIKSMFRIDPLQYMDFRLYLQLYSYQFYYISYNIL